MPRRLPWIDKGNRPQLKQPPKAAKQNRPQPREPRSDDDFFENTVLENDKNDSDHQRAPSSSPPPVPELPPEIEFMDSGVNKFDLRDDEWIMVEDEFLQTAKLFTQHLHLAEYERMKSQIEEKKNDISRPVIPDAKPSVEGEFILRAEKQMEAQKRALEDIDLGILRARRPLKITSTPTPAHAAESSDSDGLDAILRKQTYKGTVSHDNNKPSNSNRSLNHGRPSSNTNKASIIDKPSKIERPPSPDRPSDTTNKSPMNDKNSVAPRSFAGARSRVRDLWSEADDATPKRSILSKETSDRLAKRKADREAQKKAKEKDVEIPTFMF